MPVITAMHRQLPGSKVVHAVARREPSVGSAGVDGDILLCKPNDPPSSRGSLVFAEVTCKNCLKRIAAAEEDAYADAEFYAQSGWLAKAARADLTESRSEAQQVFDLVQAEADADGDDWVPPSTSGAPVDPEDMAIDIELAELPTRDFFTPADGARMRELQASIRNGEAMVVDRAEMLRLGMLEGEIDEAWEEAWAVRLQRDEILQAVNPWPLKPSAAEELTKVFDPRRVAQNLGLDPDKVEALGSGPQIAPETSGEAGQAITLPPRYYELLDTVRGIEDELYGEHLACSGHEDPQYAPMIVDELADGPSAAALQFPITHSSRRNGKRGRVLAQAQREFFDDIEAALVEPFGPPRPVTRIPRKAKRMPVGVKACVRRVSRMARQMNTDPFYDPRKNAAPVPGRLLATSKVR